MANVMTVEIVTPVASAFSGEAKEVVLPAWEGQLGVLPDHDALLTLLKAGKAVVYTDAGVKVWIIGRGFADIGGDHVTLLTDQAVPLADVDKAAALAELGEAQEELTSESVGSEAHKAAQIRAEWAQALLDA